MPTYTYRAMAMDGKEQTGTQVASSTEELATALAERGQFLVESEESTVETPDRDPGAGLFLGEEPEAEPPRQRKRTYSCSRTDLIQFTISLQTLIEAGVPLLSGLHYILPQLTSKGLSGSLAEVIEDLEQGISFSESLRHHPYVFPSLYVEIIAGGEESGKLDEVLVELVNHLEWTQEMVSTTRKALAYPIFLIIVVVAVTSSMLMFVVPRFTAIFEKMGAEMPIPTKILDACSRALLDHTGVALAIAATPPVTAFLLRFSPRGRAILARIFQRMPMIGSVIRQIAVSRLCNGLALLLDAGVNVGKALKLGKAIADDPAVAASAEEALHRMEMGSNMEEAFADLPAIPPTVSFMVATGEKTGRLSYTLSKAGAHLGSTAKEGVTRLISILEPALIVGLGLIVGGITACMLLGMYSLMDAVRNG